jgi:hypothetical protein
VRDYLGDADERRSVVVELLLALKDGVGQLEELGLLV